MPSHYGDNKTPKGFHRMPDGKLMKGDKHSDTKETKDKDDTFDDIKQGSLRRALRLKKDEKFKVTELRKVNKTDTGKMFMFRDKEYKMSPLMKKRVTLAINFLSMKK